MFLGTIAQNIKYCKKDGRFFEAGNPGAQGNRIDLDGARQMADDVGMRAVTSRCTYQQIRVAQAFLSLNERERLIGPEEALDVIVYYGPTGTGKSHAVRTMCDGDDDVYWHTGTKWWDGYDGHGTVVFDEFRSNQVSMSRLLRILDKGPLRVEYKGGYRQLLAHRFIFTTNSHPRDWYRVVGEAQDQLLRRMTAIHHMVDPYVVPMEVEVPVPEVGVPEVVGNNRLPLLRSQAANWGRPYNGAYGDWRASPECPWPLSAPYNPQEDPDIMEM